VIASLTGQGFDVQTACLMLGVAPSGYYDWKARPPSARTLRHAWLAGEIAQVHKDSGGTYGTLRVTADHHAHYAEPHAAQVAYAENTGPHDIGACARPIARDAELSLFLKVLRTR